MGVHVKLIQLARFAAALATAVSAMAVPVAASAAADGGTTDQIIVKYRAGVASAKPQTARWSALAGVALEHARDFGAGGHVLRLKEKTPLAQVAAIAKRLGADPDVEYAEPDQIMQSTLVPNDPQYVNQWGYFAPAPGLMLSLIHISEPTRPY